MVSHAVAFYVSGRMHRKYWSCTHADAVLFLPLPLHSEEKVRPGFDVQQPNEHRQEETLVVREPREMRGHLR